MHDYLPTASLEIVKLRSELLRKLRRFFEERDFTEVTTPVLSADTVVDEHLDPLVTTVFADPREPNVGDLRFLQTSPEFHMKRLLAAGMRRIYQVTPAFRGAESGGLHNTEFTMVEWYRVGDDMLAGMDLLAELAQSLFDVATVGRTTYADAFREQCAVNPHMASDEELRRQASECGATRDTLPTTDSRDDCLNLLWSHVVQPSLGLECPVIVCDYPASQAALACTRSSAAGPKVAERFELYFRGIELANGYHELTDPSELLRRTARNNELRAKAGKRRLPEASRLLSAMQAGVPKCAGVALGWDRAVMVAARKSRLDEVMTFPDRNA